jgi:hypothetical protein
MLKNLCRNYLKLIEDKVSLRLRKKDLDQTLNFQTLILRLRQLMQNYLIWKNILMPLNNLTYNKNVRLRKSKTNQPSLWENSMLCGQANFYVYIESRILIKKWTKLKMIMRKTKEWIITRKVKCKVKTHKFKLKNTIKLLSLFRKEKSH